MERVETETAAGPHRVELTGDLADARFPNLCASCGEDAPAGDVPLEKLFRRHSRRRGNTYVHSVVRVPLCGGCLASHAGELRPIEPDALRSLRRLWLIRILPYVIPMAIQLYLIGEFGGQALAELPRAFATPRDADATIWLGVAGFFAACFVMFLWLAIRAGRPLVATAWSGDPNATYARSAPGALGSVYLVPSAPTPTLATVDFGDEQFELFAPNHRAFTFASGVVAAQFAQLNASRVWDPSSPRARRARRAEAVLGAVLVVAAIVGWLLGAAR
jgi:hypothetical protein